MSRYIDKDKLCKGLKDMAKYQEPYKQSAILGVVSTIENTPTADVVEVVRCKDCFYSEKTLSDECPKECSWCKKLCFVTHENHYCSYGEKGKKR